VQSGGVPTAPAITDVIDDVESHTGTVQHNGVTNDDKPTITGTGQDGTTVYLYDGANPNPIGSAVVTGGRWTIDGTPLAQGEHRFRAVAENAPATAARRRASGLLTLIPLHQVRRLTLSCGMTSVRRGSSPITIPPMTTPQPIAGR
jgi:hypothetical protein